MVRLSYEYDDGGRRDAGYKGDTGDCVVRAIAIVTGKPYKEVYRVMATEMKAHGYTASGNAYATSEKKLKTPRKRGQLTVRKVQDKVKGMFGFKKVSLSRGVRPTFEEAHREYGDCLASTTKHVVALKDGALRDTWDGRTYEMATPYCSSCDIHVGKMVGSGYDECSSCCTEGPVTLYNQIHERKAMSIWIQ